LLFHKVLFGRFSKDWDQQVFQDLVFSKDRINGLFKRIGLVFSGLDHRVFKGLMFWVVFIGIGISEVKVREAAFCNQ
jgi:hypothetical protein